MKNLLWIKRQLDFLKILNFKNLRINLLRVDRLVCEGGDLEACVKALEATDCRDGIDKKWTQLIACFSTDYWDGIIKEKILGNYANVLVMEPDAHEGVAVLEGAYISSMHIETPLSEEVAIIKGSLKTSP